MFRKSNKEPQLDVFSSVPSMLDEGSFRQYNDENHWHNQFREQVVLRFDESIFKGLFNETMGAPNAPIRILLGMMILKESFVWSDSQLFEHCRFNLLTRSALGLFNINDPLPAESTYYLLRKRIYEYQKQNGEDLIDKAFEQITREQVKEFDVNGRSIRMDSKLIGSNIAFFTRYEIIHQTLCRFYKTLDKQAKFRLSASDRDQLEDIAKEESNKTVYRSNKEEIKTRLQPIGILIYKLLNTFAEYQSEQYQLLQRVFTEQYKVLQDKQIELRAKEEISSDSVQSPDDPECAYRNKRDHQVKGYSVNITETCSEDNLNLITNVSVDKANVPDTTFVQDAVKKTTEITEQKVESIYHDGAYHSPANEDFCTENDIDLVLTGIQGGIPRYDLELTQNGLIVTDTLTGECMQAVLARKSKRSKQNRWRIPTEKGYYYFSEQAIIASMLRKKIKNRSEYELHKRNNVEASIFQLSYPLRNNKSKYRGLFKQQMWAYCRCLWINLVRIINFIKQICQRTSKAMEISAQLTVFCENFSFRINFQQNRARQFSIVVFLSTIINFYSLY
jgi:Transposase domain (DUF772)